MKGRVKQGMKQEQAYHPREGLVEDSKAKNIFYPDFL